jgi:hypothetical protein
MRGEKGFTSYVTPREDRSHSHGTYFGLVRIVPFTWHLLRLVVLRGLLLVRGRLPNRRREIAGRRPDGCLPGGEFSAGVAVCGRVISAGFLVLQHGDCPLLGGGVGEVYAEGTV